MNTGQAEMSAAGGSAGGGRYAPGDIVNGWVLGSDMQWHATSDGTASSQSSADPGVVEELQGTDITVQLSGSMLIVSGSTETGCQALGGKDTVAIDMADVIEIEHGFGDAAQTPISYGWLRVRFRDEKVLRSVTVWYHPYLADTAERIYSQIRSAPRNVNTTGLEVAPEAPQQATEEVSVASLQASEEFERARANISRNAWLLWFLFGGLNVHLAYLYPRRRAAIISATIVALILTFGLAAFFMLVSWVFIRPGANDLVKFRIGMAQLRMERHQMARADRAGTVIHHHHY